jgi:8-oxo-dGTP pyrophosphatase MutT (NUDIX family)
MLSPSSSRTGGFGLHSKWLPLLLGFIAGMYVQYAIIQYDFAFMSQVGTGGSTSVAMRGSSEIAIPMDEFPEPAWRTPTTLDARVVTSTPFARFEIHKVRTESGEIVNDWLWTDERSHVNILVHLKDEDKYLLFRQKKYGLDKEYLAVIGGLFNKGETGIECATRELLEETGLEAEELVDLGRYRVQVNRGGGILYAYYAKNCVKSKKKLNSDDYEKQQHLKLTRDELIQQTLRGEVGEAQWVAAVALGLLYEEHKEHHSSSGTT